MGGWEIGGGQETAGEGGSETTERAGTPRPPRDLLTTESPARAQWCRFPERSHAAQQWRGLVDGSRCCIDFDKDPDVNSDGNSDAKRDTGPGGTSKTQSVRLPLVSGTRTCAGARRLLSLLSLSPSPPSPPPPPSLYVAPPPPSPSSLCSCLASLSLSLVISLSTLCFSLAQPPPLTFSSLSSRSSLPSLPPSRAQEGARPGE